MGEIQDPGPLQYKYEEVIQFLIRFAKYSIFDEPLFRLPNLLLDTKVVKKGLNFEMSFYRGFWSLGKIGAQKQNWWWWPGKV